MTLLNKYNPYANKLPTHLTTYKTLYKLIIAMNKYKIFVRNWWKVNPQWPNKLEPDPRARKTTIGYASTYEQAQKMCEDYNSSHKPGKLSRKAEFTSI